MAHMNLTRMAAALAIALGLIGCAGAPASTPAATATGIPTSTPASETQGGSVPATTTAPENTPTYVLPPPTGGGEGDVIVGGSVEVGSAVTGLPASPTEGSPEPPVPDQNGNISLTMADSGKTITLVTGQNFLLKLDLNYNWTIDYGKGDVIVQAQTFAAIPDAQGLFSAVKPGQVEFSAVGDLPCRSATPPCMAPSILFQVTIVVT